MRIRLLILLFIPLLAQGQYEVKPMVLPMFRSVYAPLATVTPPPFNPRHFWVGDSTRTDQFHSTASDTNSGTNIDSAFASIDMINSLTLLPGDTVSFIRGGLWRSDTLVIPNSGTITDWIVFNNDGSLALPLPKFYGSEVARDFIAHQSLANVYHSVQLFDIDPWDFGSNGSAFFQTNDSIIWGDHHENTLAGLDSNFEFYMNADTFYFFYDRAIANIDSIEVTQSERGIQISEEYIIIDGIDLKYFLSRCIGTGVFPEATKQGIRIRNCELAYTNIRNGAVGYGIQLFHSNMIIELNDIHNNGRRNVSLNIVDQAVDPGVTMRDVIVQDNELHDGWHTTGVDCAIQGTRHTVRNLIIRRNKIHDDTIPRFERNGDPLRTNSNFIENNGDAGDIDTVYFYSNEVSNTHANGLLMNSVDNAFVVNNTFTGSISEDTDSRALLGHGNIPAGVGGHTAAVWNNIFFNWCPVIDGPFNSIRGATTGLTEFDTIDYNVHRISLDDNHLLSQLVNNVGAFDYDQSEWTDIQDSTWEANSLTPPVVIGFTDSIDDFTIQPGSIIIQAGAYPDVLDDIFLGMTDINGDQLDSPPTPGAYQTGVSAPRFLSGLVGNDSLVIITLTEAPDTDSLTTGIGVTKNGNPAGIASIVYNGSNAEAQLDTLPAEGDIILCSYTITFPAMQSLANVQSQPWENKSITNNIDITAPIAQSIEVGNVTDSTFVITFNEALNPDSTDGTVGVTEDGNEFGVGSPTVSGSTATAVGDSAAQEGSVYLASYTPGNLQDDIGNLVLSWADTSVTNNISGLSAFYTPAFNKFTVPPTGDTITQQNLLMATLGDSGIVDKLDWFGVGGVDNITDVAFNWIDTSLTMTQDGSPNFIRMSHIAGNGSTATDAFNTGWDPENDRVNYQLDDASLGAYVLTNVAGDFWELGCQNGAGPSDAQLNPRKVGDRVRSRINDNNDIGNLTVTDSRGMWIISRTASNAYTVYRNISETWAETEASVGLPSDDFYVLRAPGSSFASSARGLAFWFWGGALTATDVRVITNACEVYADFLGIGIIP